ncbi:MAG: protoheme IX farnesyltransferase [Candidatus Saccharimonas sp.]|nr:protoheme IX farnesyltransferase [Planctomycetaceae bacterium]
MSAIAPTSTCPNVTKPVGLGLWNAISLRVADYTEIAKPRISLMVLLTVTVGYLLGIDGAWSAVTLFHAWFGIALVAMGSSALNQWFERETDGRMRRTMNRPLPSGRLRPAEVLTLGIVCGVAGTVYLAAFVNGPTAAMTALTFVLYAGVYTPLKRVTSLCTAVGAIPGALPPVLGWLAAGGRLDWNAGSLFGLLFLWQFPHFLAIAWLHKDDYCAAGLRMLPAGRSLPHVTGLLAVGYALGLIPVSLLPAYFGIAGLAYSATALVLGIVYLIASIQFAYDETRESARRVLWTSLVYLPLVLVVLTWDHLRLLGWLPGA